MRRVIGRLVQKASGLALAGAVAAMAWAGTAMAQDARPAAPGAGEAASGFVGAPVNGAIWLQPAGGVVKERIHDFNNLVLAIIIVITAFVTLLLAYTIFRFRESAHPTPSRTSHNTVLEIAWTVAPVLVLIIIAIPSFRLIYFEDRPQEADLTVNVQGRQWYWHYAYPDQGNFEFDSRPIPDDEIKPGQLRSLSVDEPLVVPVGARVRVLTTGQDVIHSFFVPSLGVQKYTIPGRMLETWFQAERPGVFYGQCNQICGTNHWFMPIEVRAVPQEEFQAWVAQARTRFAAAPATPAGPAVQLAETRQ